MLFPQYTFGFLGFVARCAVLSRELLRRRPEVLGAFVGEAAWAWGSRLAALVLNFSWSWSRALCSICSAPKDFAEVDRIKKALTSVGIEVQMSKDGVKLTPPPGFDRSRLDGVL